MSRERFYELMGRKKALIGMIHLGALPGTPKQRLTLAQVAAQAVDEARLLAEAGFDALILENMHDAPYLKGEVGPEIIAAMTAITAQVAAAVDVPLGVQVLAAANRGALAVALASGAQFIRAEGFVFSAVADEGLLETADAGPLLRYRRAIGAKHIQVWADIKKKHSAHALTGDVDLAETAHAAEFFGADGLIVTGTSTGKPTAQRDVATARASSDLPILVGSGVKPESLEALWQHADGLIVGSWYKEGGHWANGPDPARVRALVEAAKGARPGDGG